MRTLRTSLGAVTANPRSVSGEPRTSGKSREPVVGDVDPPRNPGVTAIGNMPEDPVEGADAAGPPDHPQMQFDRHHFRRVRPLAMQPVEGVDDIGGKIGGAAKERLNKGLAQ